LPGKRFQGRKEGRSGKAEGRRFKGRLKSSFLSLILRQLLVANLWKWISLPGRKGGGQEAEGRRGQPFSELWMCGDHEGLPSPTQ
jgi:hypothetical protein